MFKTRLAAGLIPAFCAVVFAPVKYTEFDELPPTQCRYVRFTINDWPHISGIPLGITEITIFGKAVEVAKP